MMHPLVNSTSSPQQSTRLALFAGNQFWAVIVGRGAIAFRQDGYAEAAAGALDFVSSVMSQSREFMFCALDAVSFRLLAVEPAFCRADIDHFSFVLKQVMVVIWITRLSGSAVWAGLLCAKYVLRAAVRSFHCDEQRNIRCVLTKPSLHEQVIAVTWHNS
jgi:hypothetical protein